MPTTQDSHITSDTEPTMHPTSSQAHAPQLLEPTASISRRPPTVIFSRAPSMEAAHSNPGRVVHTSVEALEKEMEVFLRNHIAKLLLLQESLPLKDTGNPVRDTEAMNTLHNGTKRTSAQPPQPGTINDKHKLGVTTDIMNNLSSHKHVNRLETFLENHIMVLQNLRNGLLLQFPSENSPDAKNTDNMELNKAYESLGSQFTMQVVISTFACSLILSFLSLVRDIVTTKHEIAWCVGCILSLFAMCVHLANIIVAGRGAALASEHAIDHNNDEHNVKYFRFYLTLSEQLQFIATILFVISVAVLIFIMFNNIAWPIVVIWFALALALAVFCLGYWKVSMTSKNVKYLAKLGGRGWYNFKKGMWG